MKNKVAAIDSIIDLDLYERFVLLRRFEERSGALYNSGKIGGFCHLYIGQEAVAIAITVHMHKGDSVVTSYRAHGFMLALGADPNSVMAELVGRQGGCSKGKGGSMHMFAPEVGFYGGHGIVGAQIPIGTGIAFRNKYLKNNFISIVVLGDGATNQGQFYESLNMAKLWNLPVLYIIENNGYAMGTSVERACCNSNLYNRGIAFEIHGEQVDATDIIAAFEIINNCIEVVRSGGGPRILEMKTYRYRGHSMSDPATYRTKEEVEHYKSVDPINVIKDHLLKKGVLLESIRERDKRVKMIIDEAENFALSSDLPDESELYQDVY